MEHRSLGKGGGFPEDMRMVHREGVKAPTCLFGRGGSRACFLSNDSSMHGSPLPHVSQIQDFFDSDGFKCLVSSVEWFSMN